jgi:hypothetical protein
MLLPHKPPFEGIKSLPESLNKRSLAVALFSKLVTQNRFFFIGNMQHNTSVGTIVTVAKALWKLLDISEAKRMI